VKTKSVQEHPRALERLLETLVGGTNSEASQCYLNLVTLERLRFFSNPVFVNDHNLYSVSLHHIQRFDLHTRQQWRSHMISKSPQMEYIVGDCRIQDKLWRSHSYPLFFLVEPISSMMCTIWLSFMNLKELWVSSSPKFNPTLYCQKGWVLAILCCQKGWVLAWW
jgi:hypothetical protein